MNQLSQELLKCCDEKAVQTERGWEAKALFPQDFLGFQGHFPGQPVLPAVVQIMLFRELITQQIEQQLEIKKISRAKFLKVITAEIPVTAIWTSKETEEGPIYKCLLESEGEKASSFNISLKALE